MRRSCCSRYRVSNLALDATNRAYGALTALHYAAIRGSASMLLALLGAGAERHARDRAFRTPLDWARRRLALDADVAPGAWAADLADGLAAPVLQFDPAVDDARQLASIGDEKGVVALLLLQGVSLNGVDNGSTHGATILLAACAAGKLSVVKRLLAHPDIDVNLGDRRGVSPLMQSAARVLMMVYWPCWPRARGATPRATKAAPQRPRGGARSRRPRRHWQADPDAVSIFDVAGTRSRLGAGWVIKAAAEAPARAAGRETARRLSTSRRPRETSRRSRRC